MEQKTYIAIDLKSFYASVECCERGLNALTTNLVVADSSRTSKTICLAVSPSLKQYRLPGRVRLYEVEQKIKEINHERRIKNRYKTFVGKSFDDSELKKNSSLELDYIIAKPRMAFYLEYSTKIYNIYLRFVSPEDIHVYSIDEVFIDATSYLKLYRLTAYEFAMKLIKTILKETKITATAGISNNLYLCKVAMDIVAKHIPENEDGVRIAEIDESSYRNLLWNHTPLTDFWRVGAGYAKRLQEIGINTMGDIARVSLENEEVLYKLFGVNAELLIDHAWGYEPCTISDIKKYKPKMNSFSSGQVLHTPYDFKKARIVVLEMTDSLVLELVEKNVVTNKLGLTISYDTENIGENFQGVIDKDRYGRKIPKESHGGVDLKRYTSSSKIILKAMLELYDKIVRKELTIRRLTIVFNDIIDSIEGNQKTIVKQFDLFSNNTEVDKEEIRLEKELEKEKKIQKAILNIRHKYGKNSILKATDLEEGATAIDRNNQIGGHKA